MSSIPLQSSIANLELIARQVVEGFIIGLHKSPFHGFSVEFAEHRLYNQGDNLKYVDWKVFGRNDKMFVKKFEEETNLRCCIAIDTSASMFFPEGEQLNKLQFSCIASACLSYLFKKQLDAGALAFFNENLYQLTDARSGVRHYRMLITQLEQLMHQKNDGRKTDTPAALHQLAERLHQRSMVIVFSDIPDSPEKGDELLSALQHLRYNKHEVILFHVMDGKQEMEFDFDNRPYEFVDMETQETLKLNPIDVKEEYLSRMKAYRNKLENHCLQNRIDLVPCDIREPVEAVLNRYLLKRNKMM